MNPLLRQIIAALGFILFCVMVYYFSNLVAYILIAAVLSLLGRPLVAFLRKLRIGRFSLGKGGSALIGLIVIWLTVLVFFSFLIPLVAKEVSQLSTINSDEVIRYLDNSMAQLKAKYPGLIPVLPGDGHLQPYLEKQFTSLINVGRVSSLFSSVANWAGNIFLMVASVSFILFFFLKDENLFSSWILVLVPVKMEEKTASAMGKVSELLKRYFIGMLLEILGVMLLTVIGLTIAGLSFGDAVIVGVFAGLLNTIPYIGPWIGGLFGLIVVVANNLNNSFLDVTLPLMLFVLIVVMVVQFIDNMFFQPIIYSSSVKAHPLEIFFVILMAGSFAGIPGMILAIPAYTVIRTIAGEFLSEFKLIRSLTAQASLNEKAE